MPGSWRACPSHRATSRLRDVVVVMLVPVVVVMLVLFVGGGDAGVVGAGGGGEVAGTKDPFSDISVCGWVEGGGEGGCGAVCGVGLHRPAAPPPPPASALSSRQDVSVVSEFGGHGFRVVVCEVLAY